MHAGLSEAGHGLVAFVPCDTPFLPDDLVPRLLEPLASKSLDLSVAKTRTQVHPVICVARRHVISHLEAFLHSGGRKVDVWYSTLKVAEVAFDDQPEAFRNVNTLDELRAAEDGIAG
jgi:molybdopterin-guanine dinucleotide biosynthesis protein A